GFAMKRLLMLGLALSTVLFAHNARADVDVHIGIGVPGVVIGTHRAPHHEHHHHHYHPPVRHHHYGPPVYYYPEKVYRKHNKHHKHHYKHARPHGNKHLRHGHRPPPPHAYARGHWSR